MFFSKLQHNSYIICIENSVEKRGRSGQRSQSAYLQKKGQFHKVFPSTKFTNFSR